MYCVQFVEIVRGFGIHSRMFCFSLIESVGEIDNNCSYRCFVITISL